MQKTYRSIFVSDVHLGTKDCKAGQLNNFLKHNSCDTLYLVPFCQMEIFCYVSHHEKYATHSKKPLGDQVYGGAVGN